MYSDIRTDVKRILDLQINQTRDIASIKAYQVTHRTKIAELEKEQKINSTYRIKATSAISVIYIMIGIFGSFIAKKLS